jgi:hypothetical protein
MVGKLVMITLASTLATAGPALDDCGDLWTLSEAVPALCLGQTEEVAIERDIALELITRGDWTWQRAEQEKGCVLQFLIAGSINDRDFELHHECVIEKPAEYLECINAALHAREQAICHLRHVRSR